MELGERMLCHVITNINQKSSEEMEEQKRVLNVPRRPFKRYTYKEAIEILKNLGMHVKYGSEIS